MSEDIRTTFEYVAKPASMHEGLIMLMNSNSTNDIMSRNCLNGEPDKVLDRFSFFFGCSRCHMHARQAAQARGPQLELSCLRWRGPTLGGRIPQGLAVPLAVRGGGTPNAGWGCVEVRAQDLLKIVR